MKTKTKTIQLWSAILFFVLSIFTFSGCWFADELIEKRMQIIEEPVMTFVYNNTTGEYDVKIEGIAKNNNDINLSGAIITISLYDEQGNTIGYVEDYINYIEKNATWRFCAIGSVKYIPDAFCVQSLYGYSY